LKSANSKVVYKKLMKTYGNSFQSILDYYSLKTSEQELYIKNLTAIEGNENNLFTSREDSDTLVESFIMSGSILGTGDAKQDYGKESIVFFAEDYIEVEDYPLSSQQVQRKIEVLAEKVTKGIIDSKSIGTII